MNFKNMKIQAVQNDGCCLLNCSKTLVFAFQAIKNEGFRLLKCSKRWFSPSKLFGNNLGAITIPFWRLRFSRCTFWNASWWKTVYLPSQNCKFENQLENHLRGSEGPVRARKCFGWGRVCCSDVAYSLERLISIDIEKFNQSSEHPKVGATQIPT